MPNSSEEEKQRRQRGTNVPRTMHYSKGNVIITILEQKPGREDILIEKKAHPFLFLYEQVSRQWTFMICDEPGDNPFLVSRGVSGSTIKGQLTEKPEYVLTEQESQAIIEEQTSRYQQEYGHRLIARYEAAQTPEGGRA